MVDLNIVNAITIGIIAILAILALRFIMKSVGKTSPV